MKDRLRPLLVALGWILLIGSLPLHLVLAVWEASSLQVSLESRMAAEAFGKAFAQTISTTLFDMAMGGVLLLLCRIEAGLSRKES